MAKHLQGAERFCIQDITSKDFALSTTLNTKSFVLRSVGSPGEADLDQEILGSAREIDGRRQTNGGLTAGWIQDGFLSGGGTSHPLDLSKRADDPA